MIAGIILFIGTVGERDKYRQRSLSIAFSATVFAIVITFSKLFGY